MSKKPTAKFELGQMVATPGALQKIALEDITQALKSHMTGDWGELCREDKRENEYALKHGLRLFSAYRSASGEKFYVITEADRSVTTVLLPQEY